MAEYMGACVYCGKAQLVVGHKLDDCQRIKKLTVTTREGIRATLTAKENSIKVERTEVKKSSLED